MICADRLIVNILLAVAVAKVLLLGLNVNYTTNALMKTIVQNAKTEYQKGVTTMTNEKALKELKRQVELWGKGTDFAYSLPPLKVAIKALEKQIPKKPNYKSEYLMRFCPNCDYPLPLFFKFCNHCGQALDWSDAE